MRKMKLDMSGRDVKKRMNKGKMGIAMKESRRKTKLKWDILNAIHFLRHTTRLFY